MKSESLPLRDSAHQYIPRYTSVGMRLVTESLSCYLHSVPSREEVGPESVRTVDTWATQKYHPERERERERERDKAFRGRISPTLPPDSTIKKRPKMLYAVDMS